MAEIPEWFGRASATFVGGAVAIGLVAVPTFVWLPREFDGISDAIDANTSQISEMNGSLTAIGAGVLKIESEIAGLIGAIAFANADIIDLLDAAVFVELDPNEAAARYPELANLFDFFPPDLQADLSTGGLSARIRYSDFNSQDWVFMEPAEFNALDTDTQAKMLAAFERQNVIFVYYPGAATRMDANAMKKFEEDLTEQLREWAE